MSRESSPLTVVVAIEPDAALASLIQQFKNQTRALAGDQLYLADPPHLTMYLSVFSSAEVVLNRWPGIANRTDNLTVNLTGWHVFDADPLTGNQTLVCDIAAYDKARLRTLQWEIVELLAPLRDHAATGQRFAPRMKFLTPDQQRCVEQYGFPYLGEGWEPHFTIASIRLADWSVVWQALAPQSPQGTFRCSRWRLFGLVDNEPVELDGLESHPG